MITSFIFKVDAFNSPLSVGEIVIGGSDAKGPIRTQLLRTDIKLNPFFNRIVVKIDLEVIQARSTETIVNLPC